MTRSFDPRGSRTAPEPKTGNVATYLGQFFLLAITIMFSAMAIYWLQNDVSGEYIGDDKDLGQIILSVMRKPASIVGDITYGRAQPAKITAGEMKDNGPVNLMFQPDASDQVRSERFVGKISQGTITGNLIIDGIGYQIRLERNPLASLHKQIQSHLP